MISPNSILMKSHSDWYMQMDGYTPLLSRNQLVLDLNTKRSTKLYYRNIKQFYKTISYFPISNGI